MNLQIEECYDKIEKKLLEFDHDVELMKEKIEKLESEAEKKKDTTSVE